MTVRKILTTLAMLASASQASAYDPFEDPVTAEILPGWKMADGRRMAAIRLTMKPGWHTYWRAPGDAGIPPHFDWSGARNLHSVGISWPTPQVYVSNGMRSIVYKDVVVLPLQITPREKGVPVMLEGRLSMGVCSDICMPHELNFSAMIDTDNTRPTPAIAGALASAPYSAGEAEVRASVCNLRPLSDGMEIEARVTLPSTGGREVAIIETGVSGLWVSEARTERQGDTLVAVSQLMHMEGDAFSIDRSNVRITILGGDMAVDVRGCVGG